MRSVLAVSLMAFILSACAGNPVDEDAATGEKSTKREIKSVTFITGSPPLPAQLRRNQTLVINEDLSTSFKTTDGYNTVLSDRKGKITQGQFDEIAKTLNEANYIYLKPAKLTAPKPGQGTQTVIVASDLGAHRFASSPQTQLPEVIQGLFENKSQYLPKE